LVARLTADAVMTMRELQGKQQADTTKQISALYSLVNALGGTVDRRRCDDDA
jgi:hypothetical protein